MRIRAPGISRPLVLFICVAVTTAAGPAGAADPFADLESPSLAPAAPDRGERIRLSTRTAPEASEVAPRFPSDQAPLEGQPYAPPPLRVISRSPEGQEVRTDTIRVEFNQPMVGLEALEAPDIAIPPFSVEPRISGRYLWLGTSVAAFQVEGGLPADTEFEVLVPSGLGAPSGERMDQRVRWSFRTAAIASTPPAKTAPVRPATEGGDAGPPPLPLLDRVGSPAAPIPGLEAAWSEQVPTFPNVVASLARAATSPGGSLELAVRAHPGGGAAPSTGLTVTGVSDATGEIFFQRDLRIPERSGRRTLSIPAPAEEGHYRIYVVATQDDLGLSVTGLHAWVRIPLTIRAELPTRTRAGDRFSASAVVRNLAFETREVMVRFRAAGAEVQSDPIPVSLGPGEERRVRVDAATPVAGEAVFQVAAATRGPEEALVHQTFTMPVHLCAPVTRFATYGVVDNAQRVPFVLPDGASPQAGGLEVSVTPDPRVILTDALIGLLDSDDGTPSADLLASRILALHAFRDGSRRVPIAALPPASRSVASVPELTRGLIDLQLPDGGFAPQASMRRSDLSTSAWCATALARAKEAGAAVPQTTLRRLGDYLTGQLGGPEVTHGQHAMVVRALAMLGVDASRSLDTLYLAASGRVDTGGRPVPLYAKAWLMEALHALDPSDVRIEELHRGLREAALERGDGVTFPEDPDAFVPASLHTPDRTDAVVLHALLTTRPSETLIPRISSGLISSARDGRWSTPRADVWALQALTRYYKDLGRDRTSYEARAWLGDRMFLGKRFRRSSDHARGRIPMSELQGLPGSLLRIGKRGEGRLFYRLALTTARDWALGPAEDRGLQVTRAWSLIQHGRAADRIGPFRVRVEEGDQLRLRVRVLTAAVRRRAIVDVPIPAGLLPVVGEGVDAARASSWDAVEYLGHGLRLFQDIMEPGVYEYVITLRAATPGTWVLPPVRARALYDPGVSGMSAAEEIVILPEPPLSG